MALRVQMPLVPCSQHWVLQRHEPVLLIQDADQTEVQAALYLLTFLDQAPLWLVFLLQPMEEEVLQH